MIISQVIGTLSAAFRKLEPTSGLLIMITALLLFGVTFSRSHRRESSFLALVENLVRSLTTAVIYLGIVLAFLSLLDQNILEFDKNARTLIQGGTVVDRQRLAWIKQWGDSVGQNELTVDHFVQREEVVQVTGSKGEIRFRNNVVTEKIKQESIRGFKGDIDIRLIDPIFNRYILDARYEYTVTNHSDQETEALFSFPLVYSHLYEDIQVTVDGVDQEKELLVEKLNIIWRTRMLPGQSLRVLISYSARGMRGYFYRIPSQRGIEDFSLTVSTDSKDVYPYFSPEIEALEPDRECPDVNDECTFKWSLDRVVMAPTMGITFLSPVNSDTAPLNDLVHVVRYTPWALALLAGLLMLSMIILNVPADLFKFTLFIGVYCAQVLALMGIGILGINYIWAPPGVLAVSLAIQWALLRNTPYAGLILTLFVLFGAAYPLAGLLPQEAERNSFDSIIFSLILIYLFALVLYSRIRNKDRNK